MPARHVRRTPQEQEQYQQAKRVRDRENARRRRQAARDATYQRNETIESDYLGPMDVLCLHCEAKHFKDERISNKGFSFHECCNHGSVSLDPLPEFPSQLYKLFTSQHPKSNLFIKDIRPYNNSLSFASFNANLFDFRPNRPGPFCFKIQGQIYYQINTALYPCDTENPTYGQLFIVDQLQALDYRLSNNLTLDSELLLTLDGIIRENNIFAQSYEMMRLELQRHRIAIRPNEFNPFIRGGRLFQQWIIDSYVKVEKDRIQYCKDHQKELRADTYKGLSDFMQNTAVQVGGQVGKTVVLPSTFIGSPRYMQKCYQDAMAIVNEKGKPDVFVTMTFNPNWPEIKQNLLPGQQALDRPDIVAREFHLKKDRLLDLITKKNFFGQIAAYIYVIEFQKRGLPHMHLLITLKSGFKWTTPDIVDKYISAEFSNKSNNQRLYDIVTASRHDAATVIIQDSEQGVGINHDEINKFIETRYVGPVESVYRLLSKPLHDKSHSIIRLPVHLPNNHSIIISDNVNDPLTLQNLLNSTSSMLLDYFKLNSENEIARQYFYAEIPKHFTHKKQKNENICLDKWSTRKKHFNVIGRMYSVSPTQIELFHLILLLLHVKGAVSFESLRTVDNVAHPTFTAACLALGLIENDDEWKHALEEGSKWMMPQRLRYLFVRIMIHCQPLNPEELWNQFKNPMSEDFSRYYEESISHKMAYFHINTLLNEEGRTLTDFPTMNQFVETEFPCPNQSYNDILLNTVQLTTNPTCLQQIEDQGQQHYINLNPQQKQIVNTVLEAVHNINYVGPKCIYMDGPGGSGKTYVYETIYHKLTLKNIKICVMAYTGIAATLLPQGKTVHKTFGLPVPMFQDSSSNIRAQSKEAQQLRETTVFIWDEISMAPRYALEIVNKTLQNFMNNNLPFGGKVIIVGGDLRQLFPIKVHGTRNEILSLYVKYSTVWKNFTKFSLSTNMRILPNEVEFSKFLLDLGNGTLNDEDDKVILPEQCILPPNDDLIDVIFGKLIKEKKFQEMSKCAILSARNIDVDEINKQITNLLNNDCERIYTAVDSVVHNNGEIDDVILPEHLNHLNPPSLPHHELRLGKNCIIILIRNISINEGLCNGTRLQIIDLSNHIIKCTILTGDRANQIVFLNRITLYSENDYPFTFKRRQFPVKLAFAMTINKAQGQTFKNTGIDLRKDVFHHGQLYVAMSRVRSWNSVKVYLGNQIQRKKVKNWVYKELYTEL
ncbi:uncharacterized protein LOC131675610 [Phymastichus coffea]|uniref:uncharacterized protein LOC131675610 n=1 Tax=Phymastichus coffea TaxID=108790 RepID=UPI00273BB46A|nr:uncharacterized protein LOC131675610 [Phymastichus coffea]